MKRVTNAERRAAAKKLKALRAKSSGPLDGILGALGLKAQAATLTPGAIPDYYTTPNYANSPLPLDARGNVATTLTAVAPNTGIRKFVDSLPGLGFANRNDLGQYLAVASPDTSTFPGSDYYIIKLVRYKEQLHKDLPPTQLEGYMQVSSTGATITAPSYLGPTIVANRNRPVRVKFINALPRGAGGNLFLPVDTTVMGAGAGPNGGNYTQNRATLHLHGGLTPWISDGTPHQWITPAGEVTTYPAGVSVKNVPDMWYNAQGQVVATGSVGATNSAGPGTMTFYYSNQQSARLMFYHDHAYGLTRLNVYGGEAAGYLLNDPVEQALVNGGSFKANGTTVTVAASTVPTEQVPLIIQDKTFVPKDPQLAAQDPTWDKAKWGGFGNLWLPHVYMPNQIAGNDAVDNELGGVSAMGRWDYNPWFYPPVVGQTFPPVPNPLWGQPGQPAQNPGTPLPTIVPEAFMDTPLVNGTAYPFMKVGRKAYRFRILNACNDRYLNLQLYFAKSNSIDSTDPSTGLPTLQTASGDVSMTVAAPHPTDPTWPKTWPIDGREGGVPDPSVAGPSWIQIGNECGLLPSATVIPPNPVNYEYFRRTITVLNVTNKSLYLGPAERADVIVDFSGVPDGTKIILYNDAPAPMPAFDTRNDYYTGDPDQRDSGGAPSTLPGYGPNTRTVMQFQVNGASAAAPFNLSQLQTGLAAAFSASQDTPLVPEKGYSAAYNNATAYSKNNYVHTTDTTFTYTPSGNTTPTTFNLNEKAIIEGFDMDYGRMNAQLGGTLPNQGAGAGLAVPYNYIDPPTEIAKDTIPGTKIGSLNDGTQIWRIDHQGVDTHTIHFHLFNVQVINRIALDGQLFEPDANELGWKEAVRMNPGQDVIVAIRPIAPKLPFKLPDSVRLLNPAMPAGATWNTGNQPNPVVPGQVAPGTVTNVMTNYGWEYVWHCHLLGHEENDMMRPFVQVVAPAGPTNAAGTASPAGAAAPRVTVTWTRNWTYPAATNNIVQRSTNPQFTGATGTLQTFTAAAGATSYIDATPAGSKTYYYRVRAENASAYSPWSNIVTVRTNGYLPLAPTNVRMTGRTRTSLSIAWNLPTTGATRTGVRVMWGTGASTGPYNLGPILGPNTTNFTLGALTPGRSYWIRVQAIDAAGATPSSPPVNMSTLP